MSNPSFNLKFLHEIILLGIIILQYVFIGEKMR